jgi:hypothetical protein
MTANIANNSIGRGLFGGFANIRFIRVQGFTPLENGVIRGIRCHSYNSC